MSEEVLLRRGRDWPSPLPYKRDRNVNGSNKGTEKVGTLDGEKPWGCGFELVLMI